MRTLLLLFLFSFVSSALTAQEPARKVAVTFDDLPTVNLVDTSDAGRRTMTLSLLKTLADRRIPAIGFVNERQLSENDELVDERADLLRLWLAAVLSLGYHSYSHPDLHKVPLKDFQVDVLRGERVTRELLAEYERQPQFFRHPFLHTGTDLETKRSLENFLAEHS
jgi:peptidoglycan/xylan/chitin deacetylase (PgdA/CDA1 family)